MKLVETSLALALGRLIDPKTRPRHVEVIPCKRARIGFSVETATEIDGDASGVTPLQVDAGGPQVNVILTLGREGDGSRIVARITRRSQVALALAPGAAVFAQIKSVALVPALAGGKEQIVASP